MFILWIKRTTLFNVVISDFINSFHMPLFFSISGMFFKSYESFLIFTKKKTNSLFIPFLFFYVVFSIIIPYITILVGGHYPYINNQTRLTELIFDFYQNDCQLVNGALWFMLCLFEINFISYYLHAHIKNEKYIYLISTIIGFSGLLLCYFSINLPMCIDTAFSCLPYFWFGYYIKNRTKIMQQVNNKHMIVLIVSLLFVVATIARHVEYYKNFFYNSSYYTAHITGLAGSMMIIFLSKLYKRIPIVSYIGRYSIVILCTHIILLKLYLPLTRNYFPSTQCLLIVFALIIISELILTPLFIKYLPHVTAQKNLFN